MSEQDVNSPVGDLESARRLLSATAIRALAEDRWKRARPWLDWPALVLFIVIATGLFMPAGVTEVPVPPLDGIAQSTVRAERDILIEDNQATELRRQAAERNVLPIFNHDPDLYFMLGDGVYDAFRGVSERQQSTELTVQARRDALQDALGLPVSGTVFELVENMEQPTDAATAISFFLNIALERLVVADRQQLVAPDGVMIHDTVLDQSRPLPLIGHVLDVKQLRRLMRARAVDAPYGDARIIRTWILETAQTLARPNMVPDKAATTKAREAARAAVEPVYVRIKAGEVIVRQGDRVTAAAQEKIRMLNRDVAGRTLIAETVAFALLLSGFVVLGGFFFYRSRQPLLLGRKDIYFILTIVLLTSIVCIATFHAGRGIAEGLSFAVEAAAFLLPISLVTLLTAILVNSRISLLAGIALALLMVYRVDGDIWLATYYVIGVLVSGATARQYRRRTDILKAGLGIGVVQACAVPIILVLSGGALGSEHLPTVVCALASGLLSAGCALLLIPVLEYLFEVATDLRLLELASADNPLLTQLALRSPGTYYHSVMMGNLAEAAGESIGANGLQCRVMALYHDVGKMVRPSYFVENQRGGNIHDRLPPELSARIIFAHIKDGIDIARKHRLGGPILAAITQHQGTTLLRVFYLRALEIAKRNNSTVDENEFRYPGPKPQTREAAILLLADAVEAATRAMKDPSPTDVRERVAGLIQEKVADGQLSDCDLTLHDLNQIEETFTRVLILGVHHSRIEYPPMPRVVPDIDDDQQEDDSDLGSLSGLADRSS